MSVRDILFGKPNPAIVGGEILKGVSPATGTQPNGNVMQTENGTITPTGVPITQQPIIIKKDSIGLSAVPVAEKPVVDVNATKPETITPIIQSGAGTVSNIPEPIKHPWVGSPMDIPNQKKIDETVAPSLDEQLKKTKYQDENKQAIKDEYQKKFGFDITKQTGIFGEKYNADTRNPLLVWTDKHIAEPIGKRLFTPEYEEQKKQVALSDMANDPISSLTGDKLKEHSVAIDKLESDIKNYDQQIIDINTVAQFLPKTSTEYKNYVTLLQNKKTDRAKAQALLDKTLQEYYPLLNDVEKQKLSRDIETISLVKSSEGQEKINKEIYNTPLFIGADGIVNSVRDQKGANISNLLHQMLIQSLNLKNLYVDEFNGVNLKGSDLYNVDADPESYLTSDESIAEIKNILTKYKDVLESNYDKITNPDGTINKKKLTNVIKTADPSLELDMNAMVNKEINDRRALLDEFAAKGGVSGPTMMYKQLLADTKETTLGTRKQTFDGYVQKDNFMRMVTGRENFRNALMKKAFLSPVELGQFAANAAMIATPIGWLPGMTALKDIGLGYEGVKTYEGMQSLNKALRLSIGVAEQAVLGLGFDLQLGAGDIKGESPALNLVMNGIPGLFELTKPAELRVISEYLKKLPAEERQAELMKKIRFNPVGVDLSDPSKIEDNLAEYVREQFAQYRSDPSMILAAWTLNTFKTQLIELKNNPKLMDKIDFQGYIKELSADGLGKKKLGPLNDYIDHIYADKALSDIEKKTQTIDAIINYADNFNPEILNKFAGRQLATNQFGMLTDELSSDMMRVLGLSDSDTATKVAIASSLVTSVFNPGETKIITDIQDILAKEGKKITSEQAKAIEDMSSGFKAKADELMNPSVQQKLIEDNLDALQAEAKAAGAAAQETPAVIEQATQVGASAKAIENAPKVGDTIKVAGNDVKINQVFTNADGEVIAQTTNNSGKIGMVKLESGVTEYASSGITDTTKLVPTQVETKLPETKIEGTTITKSTTPTGTTKIEASTYPSGKPITAAEAKAQADAARATNETTKGGYVATKFIQDQSIPAETRFSNSIESLYKRMLDNIKKPAAEYAIAVRDGGDVVAAEAKLNKSISDNLTERYGITRMLDNPNDAQQISQAIFNRATQKPILNTLPDSGSELSNIIDNAIASSRPFEDTAKAISSSLSKIIRKLDKGTASIGKKILEGYQRFFDFIKENSVKLSRLNYGSDVEGITKILGVGTANKIFIGLTGSVIDTLEKLWKLPNIGIEELNKAIDSLGVLFHEMGHTIAYKMDGVVRQKIVNGFKDTLFTLGTKKGTYTLDMGALQKLLGDTIYNSRKERYLELMNDGHYDDLIDEVIADKFQYDIHEYLFNNEMYMSRIDAARKVADNMNKKDGNAMRKLIDMIDNMVKKVGAFMSKTFRNIDINKGNTEDVMTFLNYAVIKGQTDLGGAADVIEGGKALFKKGKQLIEGEDYMRKFRSMRGVTEYEKELLSTSTADMQAMTNALNSKEIPEDLILDPSLLGYVGYDGGQGLGILKSIFGEHTKFMDALLIAKSNFEKKLLSDYIYLDKFMEGGLLKFTSNKEINGRHVGGTIVDILNALARRRSVGSELNKSGGVLFNSMLVLTKYSINSSKEGEGMYKILREFYNKFYSVANAEDVGRGTYQITKNFNKVIDESLPAGDNLMNLYTKLRNTLIQSNITPSEADDILSPLIFSTTNYMRMIGSMDMAKLGLRSKEDAILSLLLSKRSGYNSIPTELLEKYDYGLTKAFSDVKLTREAHNYVSTQINSALSDYISENKLDIPLDGMNYNDFRYKTMGFYMAKMDIKETSQMEDFINYFGSIVKERFPEGVKKLGDDIDTMIDDAIALHVEGKEGEATEIMKKIEGIAKNPDGTIDADIKELIDGVYHIFNKDDGARRLASDILAKSIIDTAAYKAQEESMDIVKYNEDMRKSMEINKNIDDVHTAQVVIKRQAEQMLINSTFDGKTTEELSKQKAQFNKEIKMMADNLGVTEEELRAAMNLGEQQAIDIQLQDILSRTKEDMLDAQKRIIYRQIVNGDAGFVEMMMKSKVFRGIVNEHLEKERELIGKGFQTFSVNDAGKLVIGYDSKHPIFDRFISPFVTFATLAQDNPETMEIIGRLTANSQKSILISSHYLGKEGLSNAGNIMRSMKISNYLNAFKKAAGDIMSFSLYKGIKDARVVEILKDVQKGGYHVYTKYSGKELELFKLFDGFFKDINNFRVDNGLTSIRSMNFIQNEISAFTSTAGLHKDTIINRLGGLWNFLSAEDITRLERTYGNIAAGATPVVHDFTKRILLGSLYDRASKWYGRTWEYLQKLAIKTGMVRLFGPQSILKAGQQMLSNVGHMQGIMRGNSFDFAVLDNLDRLMRKDLKFQLGGSFDEIVRQRYNSLVIGDKATAFTARRAALSQALYDTYMIAGQKGIDDFGKSIESMNKIFNDMGIKESMRGNESYIRNMTNSYIWKETKGMSSRERVERAFEIQDTIDRAQKFYNGEYNAFLGKVRTAHNTFFVMDQIPEFSSIPIVTQNRWLFGLMKWSIGKSSEYIMKVNNALSKYGYTSAGLLKAFKESPIFTQMASEIATQMKMTYLLHRMSGGEVDQKELMLSLAVPVAAIMMAFGDDLFRQPIQTGMDAYTSGKSNIAQAIGAAAVSIVQNIVGRIGLYEGLIIGDISKGLATGSAQKKGGGQRLGTFVETILKRAFIEPMTKFAYMRQNGMIMKDQDVGSLEGNIIGAITNTQTNIQRDTRRMSEKYYLQKEEDKNRLSKLVGGSRTFAPLIGETTTPDLGVLFNGWVGTSLNDYISDTKTDQFYNPFASKEDYGTLIDTLDENYIKNSDKFKNRKIVAPDNIMDPQFLMNIGLGSSNLRAFDIIVGGLKGTQETSKEMSQLFWSAFPEDRKTELFTTMKEILNRPTTKGFSRDPIAARKDFVLAGQRYGGNMEIGAYMDAFVKGYINNQMYIQGITTKDKQTSNDAEIEGYPQIDDFSDPVTRQKLTDIYVGARELERKLILENTFLLGKEKSVGQDLQIDYMVNDPQFQLPKYQGGIGQNKSNVSDMLMAQQYDKILQTEGFVNGGMTMSTILAGNIAQYIQDMKANFDLSTDKGKADYQKKVGTMVNVFTGLVAGIEKTDKNGASVAVKKMAMAKAISPFISAIEEASPESAKAMLDAIGPQNVMGLFDSITNSPVSDMLNAYEIATDTNLRPAGPKAKAGDDAKVIKEKANKLVDAYNHAAILSAKLGNGLPLSPKIKYEYDKGTGTIRPVEIKVTPPKDIGEGPRLVAGADMQSAKLNVTPLPVKEGRVIGGKYGPRAISNAKVYSRKVKFA